MQLTLEFLFIYGLLIHFLADFGLQTHDQAVNKSTDSIWLFKHVGVYSLIWFIATLPLFGLPNALAFIFFTFMTHFITDYITSRVGKPFWEKKDMHNGFVVVGFDQLVHFITLFYTFKAILWEMKITL